MRVIGSGPKSSLVVYAPDDDERSFHVTDQSCSTWNVHVEWANARVNGVHAVTGHLHVACPRPGGGTTHVDADFTRCSTN